MGKVINNGHEEGAIMGVSITSTPRIELLRRIKKKIQKLDNYSLDQPRIFIVTPNPEQLIKAQSDPEFAKILNSADFAIPDGVGIAASHRFLALRAPRFKVLRYPTVLFQGIAVGLSILFNRKWLQRDLKVLRGRDLFLVLIKLANEKKWRVYLLGGDGGVAQRTSEFLAKVYKRVNFRFNEGPRLDAEGGPISKSDRAIETRLVGEIDEFKPHLLFVAFGAPKQEKWVYKWLPRLKVGAAMVVGGTFNYVAGRAKLPPKFISAIGLEWLWRLITGSQRFPRVWSAFPVFPWKVFLYKLKS